MGTAVMPNKTLLKPVRSKTAVALHFAISAATPTALATVGATTGAAVVALYFAMSAAEPTDIATVGATASTAVVALCFAIPRGRAATADLVVRYRAFLVLLFGVPRHMPRQLC